MSAFGRRSGANGGGRPSFGTAQPMKGPAPIRPAEGGSQFPPIDPDSLDIQDELAAPQASTIDRADAMARLADRQAQSGDQGKSNNSEGFEASIHRIKEQVLPRLLERVDPEAAATLSKDELAEEFRPIIGEVLAELKINLNRREQFALEKVLVDELLGLGPLEELLNDPDVSDIMVNGPQQTYIEKKGKLELAQIQFRDEEHLLQIAQRIVNKVGRRVDQTTPLADARLQDGSRVNVIIPPLSLRGTAISIRKFSEKPITVDMMRGFGSMSEKMATVLKIAGASADEHHHLGRHRLGQDDDAQRPVEADRPGRARAHDRGRGRAPASAAALAAARDPPAQPGRPGRDHHPRPRHQRPAYAPRPDHPRRDSRQRVLRPARRDEHRPRRLDGHASLQLAARMPGAYGEHGDDVGHQGAEGGDLAPDRRLCRSHRPGEAPARRLAPRLPTSPR